MENKNMSQENSNEKNQNSPKAQAPQEGRESMQGSQGHMDRGSKHSGQFRKGNSDQSEEDLSAASDEDAELDLDSDEADEDEEMETEGTERSDLGFNKKNNEDRPSSQPRSNS